MQKKRECRDFCTRTFCSYCFLDLKISILSPSPERIMAIRPKITPKIRFLESVSVPMQMETTVVITEEKGIIIATAAGSTVFIALVRRTQHSVPKISVVTIRPAMGQKAKENRMGSIGDPLIKTLLKTMAATKEITASVNIWIIKYSGAWSFFAKVPVAAMFTP